MQADAVAFAVDKSGWPSSSCGKLRANMRIIVELNIYHDAFVVKIFPLSKLPLDVFFLREWL